MGLDASYAMAAQGFGGGMQTVGAYYGARAQRHALRAEAEVMDANEQMAELSAKSALLQGQRQEQASRLKTQNLKSRQRASMAANGVSLSSDSAINVLTTTDVFGEVDANTVGANAARAAWGYRNQGLNYRSRARSARYTAGGISPFGNALSTFLTSASSISSSYSKLNKEGAFDKDPATSSQPSWLERQYEALF